MRKSRHFRDSPIEILQMLHAHGGIVSAALFPDHHPESCAILIPFLSAETREQLLEDTARHIAEAAGSCCHREPQGSLGVIRTLVESGAKTAFEHAVGWAAGGFLHDHREPGLPARCRKRHRNGSRAAAATRRVLKRFSGFRNKDRPPST